MTSSLDEYILKELREAFEQFDRDKNGCIDRDEFKELVDSLDPGMTDEQIEIGFGTVDANGNGRIEFGEFLAWWQDR